MKTLFLRYMVPCHWAVSSHHFETMQWHHLQGLKSLTLEEKSSDYPVTELPFPEEDSALEYSGFCLQYIQLKGIIQRVTLHLLFAVWYYNFQLGSLSIRGDRVVKKKKRMFFSLKHVFIVLNIQ